MAQKTRGTLQFQLSEAQHIHPYLPSTSTSTSSKPHVTLTFATSLDSQLSLAPGVQTALSGPESKAMTHFLRSKHDAILIGVGTAEADDPSLNCRIEGVGGYGGMGLEGQPQPVVIDAKGRWKLDSGSKVLKLARENKGKAPWVVTRVQLSEKQKMLLEEVGGKVLEIPFTDPFKGSFISWHEILNLLAKNGIRSIMIEGGGVVINSLISPVNFSLVDTIIVTIAPVWLGKGGVQVCPDARVEDEQRLPVGRLKDIKWVPLGEDVVLCGHPKLT
ncbi:5-amino-6-uracil reductase-like protein [Phaeosphaeriaceae sp. PMI808]|nr:5-amino-6-uracil reductase-like protein [Phaeosphaeriaceae sp. PMI808]